MRSEEVPNQRNVLRIYQDIGGEFVWIALPTCRQKQVSSSYYWNGDEISWQQQWTTGSFPETQPTDLVAYSELMHHATSRPLHDKQLLVQFVSDFRAVGIA
jgi:hypothetical protein